MSVLDLIPVPLRPWASVLAVLLIAGAGAGGAWTVQDWRYGNALAKQETMAAKKAQGIAAATAAQLKSEQAQRLALEGRLKTNDENHSRELSNARKNQDRLSDRLATADLRLSVLLAPAAGGVGGDSLSAAPGAGGVVHGGTRAELDPAHAQRIIGITDAGDRGLIALKACQGYVRAVWEASQVVSAQ